MDEEENLENHNPFIPMEKWGRDHWSTLAYVETRLVDHDGYRVKFGISNE